MSPSNRCEPCDKTFSSAGFLARHVREKHADAGGV